MQFLEIDVPKLIANPRNARVHPESQIKKLVALIIQFGFISAVLIDESFNIIAGHARVQAALRAGLEKIPAIMISGLTEVAKTALALADNRVSEDAGWNLELVAEQLRFIDQSLEFGTELTGFESPEIDLLIGDSASAGAPDADDTLDEVNHSKSATTRLGDLWLMNNHRLLCADSRDAYSFRQLLRHDAADMVFTDSPYNVAIDGHVCGSGSIKHREFAMATGEMTPEEFTAFLITVFGLCAKFSRDGSLHYLFCDWRHLPEFLKAAQSTYTEYKNLCCWSKTNAGLGSFYRSQHELVLVFKSGNAPHTNNIQLGKFKRNRSNVWVYAGVNTFKKDRMEELAAHPTVKPIALVADAIKDCTRRGNIILDPFGGSGTTLLAAERTGRKSRLIEIDPIYVDVTIDRWQRMTGNVARLAGSKLSFDEIAQHRAQKNLKVA